jgi:hypothetical protein
VTSGGGRVPRDAPTVAMAAAAKCPSCDTPLTNAGAVAGLCPACLIELALSPLEPDDGAAALPDAAPGTLAPTLEPGRVLGDRYRIRSFLGRGGMGDVWRGYDLKLRVDVALKTVREDLPTGRRALERLRREVRMAREVSSPNVCRVFDLVEVEGLELVCMEYVDGVTLAGVLRERAPLAFDEAQEIASQLLAGLAAIHQAGLVHRDLKPENVMLTKAGRVVVMDLGIAHWTRSMCGASSGTPPYMPPEQARGETVDGRADVFAAGVMLAEMVAPGGIASEDARRGVWQDVGRDPPDVAETPWAPVIRRAVAADRQRRYESALALARALEEVALRVAGAEDARPYPGLASFDASDAAYFFGREVEVEAMWRKLRRPRLLGLIGPSGSGKSSFLRAGLLPARPDGWSAVVASPGDRPFVALAQVLLPHFESEHRVADLLRFEEPDVAVAAVAAWRRRHAQALIVVDQFEELFTQNPEAAQERYARLLHRLALEADVHVLLAMRDDFLFHCQRFETLQPVFAELTPLGAPTGGALRRAVVQPALKCGYRFEDDGLVDAMIAEVEGERGALPLLAFACAQLWDRRDRDRGVLSRAAYDEIGGVAGALAQHAEATLESIGREKVPLVRELFRNLVTAEGTRAARDRDELLSIFPVDDREVVGGILDALVGSRLLVSYEADAEA